MLAVSLAFVLVLHLLFALLMWYAMKPKPPIQAIVHADGDRALVVRLMTDSSTPRDAQLPAPPTPPRFVPPQQLAATHARPVTQEKPRPDAIALQDNDARPAPATSAATINLGVVRIPPAPANTWTDGSAKAKPPKPADDRQIMQHDSNRMHYKATRFEKYFPPPNETAGGALGRHIGDAIKKIANGMCDPKKSSTATNLLCDAPPLPPSPKDRDERLNLPPPPLANDQHPPKSLPLSACIAEYNDDKPLSYGCPLDTPDLAFQAEMRVCIDLFRAGKRLKTWCPLDTPERAAAESAAPAASSSGGTH